MRSRLSYANVMATLAVFIALGGTSWAVARLPRGSVGAAQLRRGSVTSPKLARRAVHGSAVARNTLTGTNIAEGTLGTVPSAARSGDASTLGGLGADAFLRRGGKAADADRLDGIDSSGFVHGKVSEVDESVASSATLFTVPGGGHFDASCAAGSIGFSFSSGPTTTYFEGVSDAGRTGTTSRTFTNVGSLPPSGSQGGLFDSTVASRWLFRSAQGNGVVELWGTGATSPCHVFGRLVVE